ARGGVSECRVRGAAGGLNEVTETIVHDNYQAGVGRDGTAYLAFDLSQVTDATAFYGAAIGLPVTFGAGNVAMYNDQGFLMQLLDPTVPGLFSISPGDTSMSDVLGYWRQEFATYKQQHAQLHNFALDQDPNWHMDGPYHVTHDKIVVAISAPPPSGFRLNRGMTPPFRLVVMSGSSSTGLGGSGGSGGSGSNSGPGGGADDTSGDDGSDSELTDFLNSTGGSGGSLLGR